MKNEANSLVGTSRRDVRADGSASRPYPSFLALKKDL
jgi:hypothetical protein